MADNPLTPDNSDKFTSDRLLIAWTKAVTDFYVSYSHLVALINHSAVGQRFVGQCSVSAMWETAASMEAGLERLGNELPPMGEESYEHKYERMQKHTTQLVQLTHQAQLMIHLASLPSAKCL